jgi:hypothetical protein
MKKYLKVYSLHYLKIYMKLDILWKIFIIKRVNICTGRRVYLAVLDRE